MSGETLGEVKVVRDMHERKAEMAKHADAFIALPGQSKIRSSNPGFLGFFLLKQQLSPSLATP